jgi:hypothetical protein
MPFSTTLKVLIFFSEQPHSGCGESLWLFSGGHSPRITDFPSLVFIIINYCCEKNQLLFYG